MFGQLEIIALASGLARHAGARQTVIAENVANIDTPGYKQRDVPSFELTPGLPGREAPLSATRAGHFATGGFGATADGYVPPEPEIVRGARERINGNSVSLEGEIVKAAQLRQQHEMAVTIYSSTMKILRAGIGRR